MIRTIAAAAALALSVAVASVSANDGSGGEFEFEQGSGGGRAPAVSGTATSHITGRQIANGTLSGRHMKRNTLTGREIAEARLNKVPRARNADRLGGASGPSYRVRCRAPGTRPVAGACIDIQPRPSATYTEAVAACKFAPPRPPGMRLASTNEVKAAIGEPGIALAPEGELTGDYADTTPDGRAIVYTIEEGGGRIGMVPDEPAGRRPFRCAAPPIN